MFFSPSERSFGYVHGKGGFFMSGRHVSHQETSRNIPLVVTTQGFLHAREATRLSPPFSGGRGGLVSGVWRLSPGMVGHRRQKNSILGPHISRKTNFIFRYSIENPALCCTIQPRLWKKNPLNLQNVCRGLVSPRFSTPSPCYLFFPHSRNLLFTLV